VLKIADFGLARLHSQEACGPYSHQVATRCVRARRFGALPRRRRRSHRWFC
jgi:hypothetical protein